MTPLETGLAWVGLVFVVAVVLAPVWLRWRWAE